MSDISAKVDEVIDCMVEHFEAIERRKVLEQNNRGFRNDEVELDIATERQDYTRQALKDVLIDVFKLAAQPAPLEPDDTLTL